VDFRLPVIFNLQLGSIFVSLVLLLSKSKDAAECVRAFGDLGAVGKTAE